MPASGWLPNVVPDQTIESAWGNDIRNRTVTPFADAAARTAAITAPIAGMVTFLISTKSLEWYDGTKWVSGARGFVASKGLSGNAGFNNNMYDISAGGIVITTTDLRRFMCVIQTTWYVVLGAMRTINHRLTTNNPSAATICQTSGNIGPSTSGDILSLTSIGLVTPNVGSCTIAASASCNHTADIGMASSPSTNLMFITDIGPV